MTVGWFGLALAALLLAVTVAVVVASFRRGNGGPGERGSERGPYILSVTRLGAVLFAALTLVGGAATAIATLVSDAVPVTLPLQTFWPEPYPWVTIDEGATASVVGGGISQAAVTVSGLDGGARVLLAAGQATQAATLVLVALVVALLCHRLRQGLPFRPILARSVTTAGIAVTVGGIAWQILLTAGGSLAAQQVLEVTAWSGRTPSDEIGEYLWELPLGQTTGLPSPGVAFSVDFWPIYLGLALTAVSFAFRHAERLQHDTEGLV